MIAPVLFYWEQWPTLLGTIYFMVVFVFSLLKDASTVNGVTLPLIAQVARTGNLANILCQLSEYPICSWSEQ